ncbi:hypothetical protein GALL_447200 [mine drainage metagenome]|uniref:DUF3159 domain-containing protein n=1 Tax=mine drainage metagenome TaxID=410659 RepID=A0A1J5Q845_9ZZZZ
MSDVQSTHEQDSKAILTALGGTRGLLDSGLPALVFLLIFTPTHKLNDAIYGALIISAILTIIRLARKDTLQHALSGLLGVAICAIFSRSTGKAQDFYLPGLIINVIYGTVYAATNLAGWPILGLVLGPIIGEGTLWRKDSRRKSAYVRAGWVWVALFGSRLIVQYPLYRAGAVTELGIARVIMGWPLFLLAGWLTYLILRAVPRTQEVVEQIEETN